VKSRARRAERWLWATPDALAGLVLPFFWPVVLLVAAVTQAHRRLAAARRVVRKSRCIEFRLMKWLVPFSLIAVVVAWVYSQVDPQRIGVCHDVAMYFGRYAWLPDCTPYGAPDLAIAVTVILTVWFLVTDGEVPFALPGMPQMVITRKKGRPAAEKLR
jgi:hypothetical protein